MAYREVAFREQQQDDCARLDVRLQVGQVVEVVDVEVHGGANDSKLL